MFCIKKISFLITISMKNSAHSMELQEEESKRANCSSFHKISKIASLYVDTWNNFNDDTSPSIIKKIFEKSYAEEDLMEIKDLTYSPSNCLPDFTFNLAQKTHVPFLNNFLKSADIEKITDKNIKKSLMLLVHDIGVSNAIQTLPERENLLEKLKLSVGKLYLVMFHKEKEEREVIGTGTGTFVQNADNQKSFVLSCAHFPSNMARYNEKYSFEMFFFPHFLLNEKTFPLGTQDASIPFEKYLDLKIKGVVFPTDARVNLKSEPSENTIFAEEDAECITFGENDIPNIRNVQEGKKDFVCLLDPQQPEMLPMSFAMLSEYSKNPEFFAAGYPAWGLSDNTFAIVKGQPWTGEKLARNLAPFTFPALHGMSGGPLFIWNANENKRFLIGILTGVHEDTLQSVSYPLTGSDISFLENIH